MQYLFLVGSLMILAVWAPPVVTALILVGVFVNATIVKVTTAAVADLQVSLGTAVKAIGYSLALMLVAVFTLSSFLFGIGPEVTVTGVAALALLATIFVAYVLGYSIALGTDAGTSVIVAVVSTVASGLLIYVGRAIAGG